MFLCCVRDRQDEGIMDRRWMAGVPQGSRIACREDGRDAESRLARDSLDIAREK